jgi:hypothetical protein
LNFKVSPGSGSSSAAAASSQAATGSAAARPARSGRRGAAVRVTGTRWSERPHGQPDSEAQSRRHGLRLSAGAICRANHPASGPGPSVTSTGRARARAAGGARRRPGGGRARAQPAAAATQADAGGRRRPAPRWHCRTVRPYARGAVTGSDDGPGAIIVLSSDDRML